MRAGVKDVSWGCLTVQRRGLRHKDEQTMRHEVRDFCRDEEK